MGTIKQTINIETPNSQSIKVEIIFTIDEPREAYESYQIKYDSWIMTHKLWFINYDSYYDSFIDYLGPQVKRSQGKKML